MVPALGYALAVRPYRGALADLQDRIAAEREILSRELALLESAPDLPEAIREAEAAALGAEARMLQAPSALLAEDELTDFLEASAVESRVLLEEIRSGELERGEEPPEGLSIVRLHVRGESDLQGVLGFLDRIEKSRLLLRVRGLALEPEVARPGPGEGNQGSRAAVPTGVLTFQVIVDGFTRPEGGLEDLVAPQAGSGS